MYFHSFLFQGARGDTGAPGEPGLPGEPVCNTILTVLYTKIALDVIDNKLGSLHVHMQVENVSWFPVPR